MSVSAGGVDGLVFTGGIGENSASLRALVLDRVSRFACDVEVFVIEAREDIEIARAPARSFAPTSRLVLASTSADMSRG